MPPYSTQNPFAHHEELELVQRWKMVFCREMDFPTTGRGNPHICRKYHFCHPASTQRDFGSHGLDAVDEEHLAWASAYRSFKEKYL